MTSAELCATPLSDHAPLQNFTLPNFPPCFCHPSKIEITSKSSRLVLHRGRFTVPCPVSQLPPGPVFHTLAEDRRKCWEKNRAGIAQSRRAGAQHGRSRAQPGPGTPLTARGTQAQLIPAPRGLVRMSDTGWAALPSPGSRVCGDACARWVLTPSPAAPRSWDPARTAGDIPGRFSLRTDAPSLSIRAAVGMPQHPSHLPCIPGAGWSY